MTDPLEHFYYKQLENPAEKTLFLLHGTGGDEDDFLFLNDELEQSYNIVSLRGNVDEAGMKRFFKRLEHGVFDQESIIDETKKLKEFVEAYAKEQQVDPKSFVFFGYSNGANMILATLFYYPELFHNVALLHPMLPFEPKQKLDLKHLKAYVSYGLHDQLMTVEESQNVLKVLDDAGATIEAEVYNAGHELTQEEMEDVIACLKK
ncbi:MAG: alpha/beta hydrolase [Weeksellaceae bacterium]